MPVPVRAVIAWITALGLTLAGLAVAAAPELTMEAFLDAKWPSRVSWSPTGRYLSFLWTDWRSQNLYVVPSTGGLPVALTQSADFLGGAGWEVEGRFGDWSPDGTSLVYAEDGDLHLVHVPGAGPVRLTRTAQREDQPRFSPDGGRVAFWREGDIWLLPITDPSAIRQVTHEGRVGRDFAWSPDGRWIALSVSDPSRRFTTAPASWGSLLTFNWTRASQRDVAIVPAAGEDLRILLGSEDNESVLDWSPDGGALLIERRMNDLKTRVLYLAPVDGTPPRQLYQQTDDKHLATNGQVARFSPDGGLVLFTSDEDHWNHLYTVAAAGGDPRQLTRGAFEVRSPSWSPDGQTLFFESTELGPDQPTLYAVARGGGARTRLTHQAGVNMYPWLSPAGDRLAFIHSDPANLPDVWILDTRTAGEPRRLTDSMTPELRAFPWQTPDIVSYRAKDGLLIRAQRFLPRPFDPTTSYPAVVQVHEASRVNQEVFLGPGPQKDNAGWYAWHQRLADRGYVVLNIDYRGSFGYGRDFRTADYLVMGSTALEDVVSGVDYLRTLGYVDMSRLGLCGLSAGGRMVVSVLAKYPDIFRAGIDLAGISDYLIEGGPWDTRSAWVMARLGTPDRNPDAYYEASPVNFLDGIKAPLLILHGTADANVTPAQSFRLVDELLKLHKIFDFELYPGEVHYFARRSSWLDAYRRMDAFFDAHLR